MVQNIGLWEMLDQVEPLELDAFWSLIDHSKLISTQEGIRHHEALGQLLSLSTRAEIARFKSTFIDLSNEANNDEVYKLIGGSDDGFHYRISGLISMGRASYEGLLANPKRFKRQALEYELFEYAAHEAFDEPSRSKLQATALARHEQVTLQAFVPDPKSTKLGPRL